MNTLIKILNEITNYNKFPITALIKQARNFNDFEQFSSFYSIQIYHGYYWHLTNNPKFKISNKTGPRDMSSMASGEISEKGAIMLTSDLDYWASYYNETRGGKKRGYCVLFDASDIEPKYLNQIGRGFGNEIYLDSSQSKKLKQIGVYSLNYAKSLDKKFHNTIPQSKEGLFRLWKFANRKTNG